MGALIELSDSLVHRLEQAAAREHITLDNFIERLLEMHTGPYGKEAVLPLIPKIESETIEPLTGAAIEELFAREDFLPDVNVWLALIAEGHRHHAAARKWFSGIIADSIVFCRVTQMGLLRLSTNRHVMGSGVLSIQQAWEMCSVLGLITASCLRMNLLHSKQLGRAL